MNKITDIPLSIEGLDVISKDIKHTIKILQSKEFMEYIRQCIMNTLDTITVQELKSYEIESFETREYISNHKSEIKNNTIYVWNDSVIQVTPDKFSEDGQWKRNTYPNYELSLAKIVEYGMGTTGRDGTPQQYVENWEYDVRNYGETGWTYLGSDGILHNTTGFKGRLIFHKLDLKVQENISMWVNTFLEKKLK